MQGGRELGLKQVGHLPLGDLVRFVERGRRTLDGGHRGQQKLVVFGQAGVLPWQAVAPPAATARAGICSSATWICAKVSTSEGRTGIDMGTVAGLPSATRLAISTAHTAYRAAARAYRAVSRSTWSRRATWRSSVTQPTGSPRFTRSQHRHSASAACANWIVWVVD